jgi:hypothetical protein
MLLLPEVTVRALEVLLAGILARLTIHLPLASATPNMVCPWKFTVTVSPGPAVPKTGTVTPRCRTIFDPNIGETVKPAKEKFARKVKVTKSKMQRILVFIIYRIKVNDITANNKSPDY